MNVDTPATFRFYLFVLRVVKVLLELEQVENVYMRYASTINIFLINMYIFMYKKY